MTTSSRGSGLLAERISVLPTAYAVLTTTARRAADMNSLLRRPHSAATLHALIEADGEYAADSKAISGRLGPKRRRPPGKLMENDPAVSTFEAAITKTEDWPCKANPPRS